MQTMPKTARRQQATHIALTIVGGTVLAVVALFLISVFGYTLLARLHLLPNQSGTIIGQNCGASSQTTSLNSPAAECLWAAYQHCTTATATYTYTLVDVAWRHFITVQPHGKACAVQDAVEHHNYNTDTQSLTTYQCKDLYQGSYGIIVRGCGDEGDVTIH